MKKLLLTAFLSIVIAIAVTASADQPPVTVGEGEYGCCCAWTEWADWCPVDFLTFWSRIDEVCAYLDDAGNIVGFCRDDPDGVYIFRGMSWLERVDFIVQNYGIEPTVGSMVDLFCGIDRMHAPGSE
jgi:hypothetical protein